MNSRSVITFLLLLVWFSASAQVINADRPQFTRTGEIVPHKTFSIESGFNAEIRNSNNYRFSYNETTFRIGLLELMEMNIGFSVPAAYVRGAGHSVGFASPRTGLKVLMKEKEEGKKMGLAFIGEVGINVGTKKFKNTKVLPAFRIAMDIDVSERTNILINYGSEWLENRKVIDPEGNPVIDPFIVLAATVRQDIGDKAVFFAEVYARVKYDDFTSDYVLNSGFIWKVRDNVQIDIAGGAGLSPDSPRGFVQMGFAGLWPKKNFPE